MKILKFQFSIYPKSLVISSLQITDHYQFTCTTFPGSLKTTFSLLTRHELHFVNKKLFLGSEDEGKRESHFLLLALKTAAASNCGYCGLLQYLEWWGFCQQQWAYASSAAQALTPGFSRNVPRINVFSLSSKFILQYHLFSNKRLNSFQKFFKIDLSIEGAAGTTETGAFLVPLPCQLVCFSNHLSMAHPNDLHILQALHTQWYPNSLCMPTHQPWGSCMHPGRMFPVHPETGLALAWTASYFSSEVWTTSVRRALPSWVCPSWPGTPLQ